VTLPVFFTRNEYATVEPADIPDGVPALFVRVTAGAARNAVSVESLAVTAAPEGGRPDTVAVFATCPASTSACVTVYVFVHVVLAPGANDVTGHVIVPTLASVTPTLVNVTLPEFVTTNAYAIVDPATEPVGAPACLSNVTAGVRVIVVDTELVAVTAEPVGGVPDAVAVLFTVPASTSPCVNEYDFVHVVDTPGASWATGQVTVPTFGSLTPIDVKVTLPVFFTTNEYATVEPADIPDGAPAVFVNVTAGPDAIVVSVESDDVTAAPDGGVPVAVAVFAT
jgi:hypothetical protein